MKACFRRRTEEILFSFFAACKYSFVHVALLCHSASICFKYNYNISRTSSFSITSNKYMTSALQSWVACVILPAIEKPKASARLAASAKLWTTLTLPRIVPVGCSARTRWAFPQHQLLIRRDNQRIRQGTSYCL